MLILSWGKLLKLSNWIVHEQAIRFSSTVLQSALTEPLRFYHFSVALVVTLRVIRVLKLRPVSDLLHTGKISSRMTLYLKC